MSAAAHSSLEIALSLARRGLSIIPVPRPIAGTPKGQVGDGKVPAISWKEFQQRRATEDEIRRWFAHEQNIAIITGAISGVVVVDVDSSEAHAWIIKRLPRTPWQVKTARGYHLFYRHPGRLVRNKARINTGAGQIALDVRGDGGFVIAPRSIHETGVRYEFGGNWNAPREQLPMFWLGWLERPKPPPRPSPPSSWPTGNVVERARRYLQQAAAARERGEAGARAVLSTPRSTPVPWGGDE